MSVPSVPSVPSARRALLLFLSAAAAAALVTPGAAQQATFKGGVRTVAVYATVTDLGGRLVPNLAQGDFEIQDNGKPQEISIFANDMQPITVVLLLDRSGSMRRNFKLVEEAAEELVHQLQPDDKARIGSFADRIQIDPRDFTSDQEELVKILRTELQSEGPTPLWNAINVGITALLHQQGRRVVLVFTDGADRPMMASGNNSSLKDVMKRAEEEDIMVYAIGLSGQNGPLGGWSRGRGPGGGGPGGGRGGRGGWGGGPGGWGGGPGGWGGGQGGWGGGGRRGGFGRAAPEKPDEGLQKIAAETGGGYFELTSGDQLASTFRRVVDELHHQYVLGFTPTSLDGKTHKLDVRARVADMKVRARRSYLASTERP